MYGTKTDLARLKNNALERRLQQKLLDIVAHHKLELSVVVKAVPYRVQGFKVLIWSLADTGEGFGEVIVQCSEMLSVPSIYRRTGWIEFRISGLQACRRVG